MGTVRTQGTWAAFRETSGGRGRFRRAASLAAVATAALVLTGSALALAPSIAVQTSTSGTTTLWFSQQASDSAAQSVTYYVPYQYVAPFGQTTGQTIGTAKAQILVGDTNSTVNGSGLLVGAAAIDPVTVGGANTTVGGAATGCTGTATHFTYWIANLTFNAGSAGTQTLSIPIYIDTIPSASNLAELFGTAMTFCLPPTNQGVAGRAPAGARVLSLQFVMALVLSAAPGWYQWDSLSNGFTATGAPDLTNKAEAQGLDQVSPALTGKATTSGGGKATVSGKLTSGGAGVGSQTVNVYQKGKLLTKLTTSKSGSFSGPVSVASGLLRLQAVVPVRSNGACQRAWFAPAPCTGLTLGGFTVSQVVRIGRS
jgi:hypothetical protein